MSDLNERLSGHVLITDDIEMNREVLVNRLERLGCTCATAANGVQALAYLRQHPTDLVLLDIMMPQMDGFETLRQMKADPALRDIPVIVISAVGEMTSVARCIELGAEDFLPKPFDPIVLKARVRACLERKRLRDQEREYIRQIEAEKQQVNDFLDLIVPIGADLAEEHDFSRLLHKIVESGRLVSSADGGILYLRTDYVTLEPIVILNAMLGTMVTASDPKPAQFGVLNLSSHMDWPVVDAFNNQRIVACASDETGCEDPFYQADQTNNQRTLTQICLPLRDHERKPIGVMQYTNARSADGVITPFGAHTTRLLEALGRFAAAALLGYIRTEASMQMSRPSRVEVHIDQNAREAQVAQIAESEYFQRLHANIRRLRDRVTPSAVSGPQG
ncbi:MAG: response regulator [Pleurocapsa minor GSE-CHR-MK-17-07R]|jgi:CheY-like chemotaxis protein|nr:response regulator [Pleurocapsa minor GSE-CHR-MK 17-07R]